MGNKNLPKEKKLTVPSFHVTYYGGPSLPFYIDLRGDSYCDIAMWEAKKLHKFLGERIAEHERSA